MVTAAAPIAFEKPTPKSRVREAAPFVKWVGGKGKLVSQLLPLMPGGVEKRRHVEPFVGGGALFFAMRPRRAVLSDVNERLVTTYLAIRDELPTVIRHLEALDRAHSDATYYEVRDRYNTASRVSSAERAAMFVYLNKTCFNGLHRVNRRGHFNVPLGRYENPRIVDHEGLAAASRALRGAEIRHASFEELLAYAKPGDFVYFDPPYAPVSATANFTSYAAGDFGDADQVRLRDVYRELDRRGCRLMLSNSDVPRIRELYRDYRIEIVAAPRAINCDARKRGPVTEVVVLNYDPGR
ncbi:MAG: DNA adenine methylase [Myxococcales bacterium]|nr:DNA adenine methylase [Myxococcales bacterium]